MLLVKGLELRRVDPSNKGGFKISVGCYEEGPKVIGSSATSGSFRIQSMRVLVRLMFCYVSNVICIVCCC